MSIERLNKDGSRDTIVIVGPTVSPEKLHKIPREVQQRIAGPQREADSADFWHDKEDEGSIYHGGTLIMRLRGQYKQRADALVKALNGALKGVIDAPKSKPAPAVSPRASQSRYQQPTPRPKPPPSTLPPPPAPKPKPGSGGGGPHGPDRPKTARRAGSGR